MRFEITIENGDKQIFTTKKTEIMIGRSDSNDICVKCENLGRKHLCIIFSDGRYFVTDLGSANGTTINGERLVPNKQVEWHNFFPIVMSHKVTLQFSPEEEVEEVPRRRIINEYTAATSTPNLELIKNTKKSPTSSKKSTQGYSKADNKPAKILGVLAIALIGYVYFTRHQNQPQLTEVKDLHGVANFTKESLNEFFSKDKCKTEVELSFCGLAQYKFTDRDGFLLHKDDLYYFLDFQEHADKGTFPEGDLVIAKSDLIKFLMMKETFRDTFRKPLADSGIVNFYIVNYTKSPFHKILSVLRVNTSGIKKISPQDAATVFKTYQTRDKTIYKALMAPLLEWSE